MTTFYLSNSNSRDHQLLWREAVKRGWQVERIRGISVDQRTDIDVAAYLEPLYAPTISARLDIQLADPPLDWLTRLPFHLTRRSIVITTAAVARLRTVPCFVKPPNDKSFAAKVISNGDQLPSEIDDNATILISSPVQFVTEYRCIVVNNTVTTISPYVRNGELAADSDYECPSSEREAALAFATDVISIQSGLPSAVVVDVGILADGNGAVVEANGVWGAGIYGCEPSPCLDAIHAATRC